MKDAPHAGKMRRLFWAALLLYFVGFCFQVASGPDPGILGMEFAFTESRAGALLEEWGDEGKAQARKNISLDFLFIAGYVSLLVVVILWTMREDRAGRGWLWQHGKTVVWLTLAAGGLDVIENLLMRHVVRSSSAVGTVPVAAAGVAATLKFALIASVLGSWFRWVWRNRPEIVSGIKHWIIDFWSILKMCRASVVVLAMGTAFLVLGYCQLSG